MALFFFFFFFTSRRRHTRSLCDWSSDVCSSDLSLSVRMAWVPISTKVLDGVAAGEIHVLIGTHAILTDKLRFKNLGLLVIDEEHRFGVKHKEKRTEERRVGKECRSRV